MSVRAEAFAPSKRQKHNGDGNSVDRISALPDAILTYLLSFLRTKEAVRTCVLSKRWRYAWTSVSNLEFSEALDMASVREDLQDFKKYVDGVLSHHDYFSINMFTMKFYSFYHHSHISKWVSAATIRRVEELHIIAIQDSYRPHKPLGPLPLCLFTCERLKVLKIEGLFALQVPALVCLNRLKVLWLDGIEIIGESSLNKLLLSAPQLDELHLSEYSCRDVQTLYICSLTLKRLFIGHGKHSMRNICIVVDSPSLIFLGVFSSAVSLRSSPSLVSVNIGIHSFKKTDAIKLFQSISSVVRLQLCDFSKYAFEDIDVETEIPIYPNLKHLEIELWEGAWRYVPNLLQRCPNLSSLGVELFYFQNIPSARSKEDKKNPLNYLPSDLEEIMIRYYRGCDYEIEAIGHLLAKANVLKKMTIFFVDGLSETRRNVRSGKVLRLPRCSTTCEIVFPRSSFKRQECWV